MAPTDVLLSIGLGSAPLLFSASLPQGGQWDKLQSPLLHLVTTGTHDFPS